MGDPDDRLHGPAGPAAGRERGGRRPDRGARRGPDHGDGDLRALRWPGRAGWAPGLRRRPRDGAALPFLHAGGPPVRVRRLRGAPGDARRAAAVGAAGRLIGPPGARAGPRQAVLVLAGTAAGTVPSAPAAGAQGRSAPMAARHRSIMSTIPTSFPPVATSRWWIRRCTIERRASPIEVSGATTGEPVITSLTRICSGSRPSATAWLMSASVTIPIGTPRSSALVTTRALSPDRFIR